MADKRVSDGAAAGPAGRVSSVLMLFLAIVIVAADKSIFAFSVVRIRDELRLTPLQFGMLGSAFYLLYSVHGVAIGLPANRWPARWVIGRLTVLAAGACSRWVDLGRTKA